MKIFYITASFPFGTGESFLIPEIQALNNNIDLYIIPIFPRGKLRNEWISISSNYKLYSEKLFSKRILFSFLCFAFLHPVLLCRLLLLLKGSAFYQFIKNLAILPKSIWIASKIVKEAPDHIHAHWGSTSSTTAMLASYITSIPWSFTCHRWDIYENNLLKRKSELANFVRFISNKGKLDSFQYGVSPDKTVFIPMGTELPEILHIPKWDKDGMEFIILCPANLIPVKGHIFLIEAIDTLVKNGYKIKLLLAGEGLLKNELQNFVRNKNIEQYVAFLGQISHDSLLKFYKDEIVHLTILPSIDLGNGEHEGVPVSLMEAMSYGVPVISTKTGSIGELLPESLNITVPDKNPEALAAKIAWLYDTPAIYAEIGIMEREIILKNWNVRISVQDLLSRFEET